MKNKVNTSLRLASVRFIFHLIYVIIKHYNFICFMKHLIESSPQSNIDGDIRRAEELVKEKEKQIEGLKGSY